MSFADNILTLPERPFVFLGGACGTTTWRKDIAIPTLEQADIAYYNPQQESWRPELEALEQQAKQYASDFLFIITGETRGTASRPLSINPR